MDLKPGYKQNEFGVIPEDWEVRPLGELTDMGSGGTPLSSVTAYYDGEIPWVSISDMTKNGKVIYKTERNLSASGLMNSAAQMFPAGTVLYAMYASLGECSIAGVPVCTSQAILGIRSHRGLHSEFLYYFLTSLKPKVKTLGQQGTQANLNKAMVQDFQMALPASSEQAAIATALSDVDDLITKLDQLIDKKRDLKQAAMQELLTGKTRLPGFSGEWEVRRLGDHVTFLRNGVNSRAELNEDGPVKYLHYGDIHTSNRLLLDPETVAMPALPENLARNLDRLRGGDLIFVDASEDIDGVGKSVELSVGFPDQVVAGLHTIAARFARNFLADGFKAYLQFCPDFLNQLRRLAAGTKVYATNRAHIASVEIALPEVAEQTAIASILLGMDAEISALEARRDKTHAIKQGMMQVLLTGQVRLPVSTEPMGALA